MKINLDLSDEWDRYDISKWENHYNVKFVCETPIKTNRGGWFDQSSLIFYSKEPHPQGSNYMAVIHMPDIDGGWKTVITLLNPSAAASLVNVKFYDVTGTPMAVTVEGQKTSQFPALVPSNGVATLTLSEPSGTITSGTIEFSTVYGTAPKAFVAYDNSNFQAIIPAAVPNVSSFSLGFNETGNSRTGLALGNYLNFTQVINLQFYDSLGNYIETQMLTLPPYGSTSIILQNMDPALAGKTGLVKVSALHSGISGFGINLNVAKGYFVTSPEF